MGAGRGRGGAPDHPRPTSGLWPRPSLSGLLQVAWAQCFVGIKHAHYQYQQSNFTTTLCSKRGSEFAG